MILLLKTQKFKVNILFLALQIIAKTNTELQRIPELQQINISHNATSGLLPYTIRIFKLNYRDSLHFNLLSTK